MVINYMVINRDAFGAIPEGLDAIAVILSVLYHLAIQVRMQIPEVRLVATRDLSAQSRRVAGDDRAGSGIFTDLSGGQI